MPRSFIIIIPLHRHSTLLSLSPLSYSPGSSKLWLYLVMSLSSFMRPSRQMRLVKTHNYTNWPPFIVMIPDFKWTLSTIQQSDYIFKVHLLSPCPEMLLPTFSSLLKLPLTLHSQPMRSCFFIDDTYSCLHIYQLLCPYILPPPLPSGKNPIFPNKPQLSICALDPICSSTQEHCSGNYLFSLLHCHFFLPFSGSHPWAYKYVYLLIKKKNSPLTVHFLPAIASFLCLHLLSFYFLWAPRSLWSPHTTKPFSSSSPLTSVFSFWS